MATFGLGTFGQYPFGGGPTGTTTVTDISWYAALSEPVRQKKGSHAARVQFFAFDPVPSPFVPTGWFMPLSEPQRRKRRTPDFPFLARQPMPSPFVPTGWYEPLSEPQRKKPRSPAALWPAFFFDPAPSPFVPTGWFEPLSDPQWQKKGLRAALQQAYSGPSQLRPTPTIFAELAAVETKDTFLASVRPWNQVGEAEIGVVAGLPFGTEIGAISSGPASASATILSVRISIRIE